MLCSNCHKYDFHLESPPECTQDLQEGYGRFCKHQSVHPQMSTKGGQIGDKTIYTNVTW